MIILCVGILLCSLSVALGDVRISEFLAANEGGWKDERLKSPDWIELCNHGPESVDLQGFYLTDDAKALDQWQFPVGFSIRSGDCRLVFASGKDEGWSQDQGTPEAIPHTNFKLSRDGGYLALVAPDGRTVLHEYAGRSYPPQFANVSYGTDADGGLGYFDPPTPQAANRGCVAVGPRIQTVANPVGNPIDPSTPTLVISARLVLTESDIAGVTLYYRVMHEPEIEAAMRDDGVLPDREEGDGVFTGEIPLGAVSDRRVQEGEMLRWRLEARDVRGAVTREPFFWSSEDSDQYHGSVVPESTVATSSRLSALRLFVETPEAANTATGTRASIWFRGQFYDNVRIDRHGQNTRSFPKKSWDIDFNRGNRFKISDAIGKVKDINLLTNWADKSRVRNTIAYEMYGLAGAKAHFAFPVRVQQNGAFLGIWDLVEDGDDAYLKRVGLDSQGALYKMNNRMDSVGRIDAFSKQGADKKTRRFEDKSDLQLLIDGLTREAESERIRTLYDHIDLPAVVNFLAMNVIVGNSDFGPKNYYLYRDSEGDREWRFLPWDLDLTFGRRWESGFGYFMDEILTDTPSVEGHVGGNVLGKLVVSDPILKRLLYRRLRTLADFFYGPPEGQPKSDYLMRRLQELEDLMDPQGVVSDADMDYQRWGSWGNYFDMRREVDRIRQEYLPGRRKYLYGLNGLPAAQKASTMLSLEVRMLHPQSASGSQMDACLEIENVSDVCVDLSNFVLESTASLTLAPGTVLGCRQEGVHGSALLHIVRDAQAYRDQAQRPKVNARRFVVGGLEENMGVIKPIRLLDAEGNVIFERALR